MSRIYLFDVDGTLTHPKTVIDPDFQKTFHTWVKSKEAYIISGGSFARIVGQLGQPIVNDCRGIFACMGNTFLQEIEAINPTGFSEWKTVYENSFKYPRDLRKDLKQIVEDSPYPVKTGRHAEERTGMVNFSIVGQNANTTQRADYAQYDKEHAEREQIVTTLKDKYPKIDFVIGGAVSIDIFNVGNDKSQVLERYFDDVLDHNEIIFVGDRIPFPGNDYALAIALRQHPNGSAYEVETWRDTAELLKTEPFA